LPAIVDDVLANADSLPVLAPGLLENALVHLELPMRGVEANSAATQIAIAILRKQMPSPQTHPALDALKALRDKRLAHAERIAVDQIPRTAWDPADELLRTGKLILAAIGSLTSTAYVDHAGEYFLTSDAQRASVATHRLMRQLHVAPRLAHTVWATFRVDISPHPGSQQPRTCRTVLQLRSSQDCNQLIV
jgi:hypothetical protein